MAKNESQDKPSSLYQRIYALVEQIPPGNVTTYGRIAKRVGTTPRVVGFAMAALPNGSSVPWQRVVNSKGEISARSDGEGNLLQRELLQCEGVLFDRRGRIDLGECCWTPAEAGRNFDKD
ncbi:MAG: cysteine methyltransferase [Desulfuromonas sp.]|nr:MAG: cysteine methyltransferase [Desulfuromonas sp.]